MSREQKSHSQATDNSSVLRPALILALIALACSSTVVVLNQMTFQRIETMRERRIQQQLQEVLPADLYNNQLLEDTIMLSHSRLGGTAAHTIWRARIDGRPAAAILSATAPDGYGGPITLLIGVQVTGELTGVRVISHRETPGLGDGIEIAKSDWIRGFDGYSLVSLPESAWRVKKDGGIFDHFTGATITPRAITTAVHSALIFFEQNQEAVFASDD